jgi:transcriptional regulator GlxA family with amidase domain
MLPMHSAMEGHMARRFSAIPARRCGHCRKSRLDPAAMLVDGGGVTTGSFTATFDLAMQLIRQTAAPTEARAVARMALLNQRGSNQGEHLNGLARRIFKVSSIAERYFDG